MVPWPKSTEPHSTTFYHVPHPVLLTQTKSIRLYYYSQREGWGVLFIVGPMYVRLKRPQFCTLPQVGSFVKSLYTATHTYTTTLLDLLFRVHGCSRVPGRGRGIATFTQRTQPNGWVFRGSLDGKFASRKPTESAWTQMNKLLNR